MESLFLLIPIGIVFIVVAVWIFVWAINNGQYDNLDTEAHRILFDEDDAKKTAAPNPNTGQAPEAELTRREQTKTEPPSKTQASDNDSDQNQGSASGKAPEEPDA